MVVQLGAAVGIIRLLREDPIAKELHLLADKIDEQNLVHLQSGLIATEDSRDAQTAEQQSRLKVEASNEFRRAFAATKAPWKSIAAECCAYAYEELGQKSLYEKWLLDSWHLCLSDYAAITRPETLGEFLREILDLRQGVKSWRDRVWHRRIQPIDYKGRKSGDFLFAVLHLQRQAKRLAAIVPDVKLPEFTKENGYAFHEDTREIGYMYSRRDGMYVCAYRNSEDEWRFYKNDELPSPNRRDRFFRRRRGAVG